jgi:beta-lactamase regulating signal transducer with metallopeptidase domain
MSVSVIDWLNQWLPFAKLLTLAALIFLFPLLLEACNRLRYRPLRLSASQRHDVWGIALIVWALSPILCVNEVTWSIPIKAFPATDASRSVSDLSLPLIRIPLTNNETISSNLELQEEKTKTFSMEHPASFGSKPPLERMETMDRIGSSSLRMSLGWQHAWLALSAGGTVLLLIRLVRAQIIATALVRSANLGRESRFIQDLMRQCSISNKIRLGWSECTSVPILIGWLRPVILLPREAQNWPPCKLESVLLHEHAHIQRADLLWLRLANIICAIYWVQPWVWFASHRMRCLREEACDDLVISFGKDRREYSEHLIQIAERATYPVINVAGLGIARSTSLGNRIIGILDLRRNRARSSLRFKSIVCFALTILFG